MSLILPPPPRPTPLPPLLFGAHWGQAGPMEMSLCLLLVDGGSEAARLTGVFQGCEEMVTAPLLPGPRTSRLEYIPGITEPDPRSALSVLEREGSLMEGTNSCRTSHG